jgi:hypothetical protein
VVPLADALPPALGDRPARVKTRAGTIRGGGPDLCRAPSLATAAVRIERHPGRLRHHQTKRASAKPISRVRQQMGTQAAPSSAMKREA